MSKVTDHIVDMHEMVTDTNQASEIAEQIIQDIIKWNDGQWDYNGDDPRQKGTKAIQSLIRNEKLKTKMDLLKTIRRSYPKKQTLRGNAQSKLTLADIDRLIGETKMEAEL